jgi:hypothetical protein
MGWFLDHDFHLSNKLIGTWNGDNNIISYHSQIVFDQDGYFTKTETHRGLKKVFSGRWSNDLFGKLTIHLDSVVCETDIDLMIGVPATPEAINTVFQFQWEYDRTGLLVLIPADPSKETSSDPIWEQHYRKSLQP